MGFGCTYARLILGICGELDLGVRVVTHLVCPGRRYEPGLWKYVKLVHHTIVAAALLEASVDSVYIPAGAPDTINNRRMAVSTAHIGVHKKHLACNLVFNNILT